MTAEQIADIKEQVFGNGQSSTHTPTPPPTNDTPIVEPEPTATAKTADTNVVPTTVVVSDPPINSEEIVDDDIYLKQQLGVNSWDEAKAALAELTQLREAAKTPKEVAYANEQSKALHEAIIAGKTDEVFEILDTQKKLSAVSTMKPAEAIKLHIQQTNKHFKSVDVDDVFEEKYTYPDKPVQGDVEEDTDFEKRSERYKVAVEKIDRRIERDAATAKDQLSKLSAELKLPEIQKPVVPEAANVIDEKEIQRLQKEATEAYSKMTVKDIQMVFKFNDEASKLAFDITYEPEKETFDESVALASNINAFFENYLNEDGSPKRAEFLRDIYAGRNIQKIVSEAIVQAVSQERIRALKYQKNIGDVTQRNYVVEPPTQIDYLRQAVFGKS